MRDEKDLHSQLKRPPVPTDLAAKIQENWRQQRATQQSKRPLGKLLAGVSAMVFILSALVIYKQDPVADLISAAMSDIDRDAQHHVGIAIPPRHQLLLSQVHLPPSDMPIEMSKRCNLIGNDTLHLKIAGVKRGYVHLFIKTGEFQSAELNSDKGARRSMPWRLLKPRNDLSVLVLYTNDMNPDSVDKLIKTMFYA